LKGAVTIPATSSTALPSTPMVTRTANYTTLTTDQGKWLNANPTSASRTITLLSAVTAGDGFAVGIRHVGTANVVTVRTVGSETLLFSGQTKTAFTLTGKGHGVWIVSDGANWHVTTEAPALMPGNGLPMFLCTDRLTAPPSSTLGGQRYIINGTPTGAWSTLGFVEKDIVESDGNGSWFAYTPAEGWLAYVEDENLYTAYVGTAWADQTGMSAPSATVLAYAQYEDQKTNGTAGGASTASAWTTRTLNTEVSDTIGITLSANAVTLPVGTYYISASAPFHSTLAARLRFTNLGVTNLLLGENSAIASGGGQAIISGFLVVAVSAAYTLDYWIDIANASGLGYTSGDPGVETYARLSIVSLAAQQGPVGAQGPQGVEGLDGAYPYQWSITTSGDPGSGCIRGNSATVPLITQMAVSTLNIAGGGMAPVIATWDDSTSTTRALIKVSKEGATNNFHAFRITGAGTDNTTYWTFPVDYVTTSGTISNNDNLALLVVEKGDKGDQGADGGISFTFSTSTTTTADPGTGNVRFNNATPASVTEIAIDDLSAAAGNPDVSALVLSWDDSTTTPHRGTVRLSKYAAEGTFVEFAVTGASVDEAGWTRLAVTYVQGAGALANADPIRAFFARTGNAGATGSAGATGATGATGPNMGLDFSFSTATSGDPGSGNIILNNATPASVTQINISETDRNLTAMATTLATWALGTTALNLGTVRIVDVSNRANWVEYTLTAIPTDVGAYRTLPVSYVGTGGAIANNSIVSVLFLRTGDKGVDGNGSFVANRWRKAAAGGETSISGLDDSSVSLTYTVGAEQVYLNGVRLVRSIDYTATTGNSITALDALIAGSTIEVFSYTGSPNILDAAFRWNFAASTTMADPGTGTFRLDNATLASVTAIAIYYTSADVSTPNLATYVKSWDDSTNTIRGQLIIKKAADGSAVAVYNITGTITDNTTWGQFTLAYVSSAGSFAASDAVSVAFVRSGDSSGGGAGDVVGPASSVASEIALFDLTTGKLLKRATTTGMLKGTSGVLSAATEGTDYYGPAGTDVAVTDGGTGRSTGTTAYSLVATGTTATGAQQTLANGATTEILVGGGAAALPVWTSATGSGAPVRATSPTLVTPALGTPSALVLTNATGLPVAGGGTGSSTAAGARTNFGLVIGTDVQAQDAELAAIAGLTSAADRLPYFTGSGTAALATFTTAGRALVDDADAAAQRVTLGFGATVIQEVISTSSLNVSTTVAIPADSTIPQITEGAEFMTVTITPKSASSTLMISFDCPLTDISAAGVCTYAMFVDSTANALNASGIYYIAATAYAAAKLTYSVASGSTSARTYRIRFGPYVGTTMTAYANVGSTVPVYGAAVQSTLTVKEIL
jgi:hypothetical protein